MPQGHWGPWRAVLLLLTCTGCLAGIVRTENGVTAVLGLDVSLTCYYKAQEQEKVTQVIWSKKNMNGQNIQVAILNTEYGAHIPREYEGRVKENSPLKPEDGSIILKNVVQADEGIYQCRVYTFPSGTFEAEVELKVLVPPLPTLNPGQPLVEGVGLTLAASCTAEGSPAPTLTWETEVSGKNISNTYSHARSASVTSEFYVVPTRSMHKKLLTCVVSHPVFQQEKRITHVLEVEYLADITIQGYEHWFAGKDDAALRCLCDGYPTPKYTWVRVNGSLPKDVKIEGNQLRFTGPLLAEDAGVYICEATNGVTTRQASVMVTVTDSEPRNVDLLSVSLVSVAVVTGLLVLILVIIVILVNRHHKRKTKRLSEKIEELSTLSRQTSRRRLNSNTASTDTRMQECPSTHSIGHRPQDAGMPIHTQPRAQTPGCRYAHPHTAPGTDTRMQVRSGTDTRMQVCPSTHSPGHRHQDAGMPIHTQPRAQTPGCRYAHPHTAPGTDTRMQLCPSTQPRAQTPGCRYAHPHTAPGTDTRMQVCLSTHSPGHRHQDAGMPIHTQPRAQTPGCSYAHPHSPEHRHQDAGMPIHTQPRAQIPGCRYAHPHTAPGTDTRMQVCPSTHSPGHRHQDAGMPIHTQPRAQTPGCRYAHPHTAPGTDTRMQVCPSTHSPGHRYQDAGMPLHTQPRAQTPGCRYAHPHTAPGTDTRMQVCPSTHSPEHRHQDAGMPIHTQPRAQTPGCRYAHPHTAPSTDTRMQVCPSTHSPEHRHQNAGIPIHTQPRAQTPGCRYVHPHTAPDTDTRMQVCPSTHSPGHRHQDAGMPIHT
ncbi:nectin-4 isoform X5 [Bufo bufo]|uniref:nectin-4 isoform X5 n=1 Tax=Bufo bufo TaxID=8384 RepID=UPI001ABEAD42|nr:nectin-4 isoform X5 [Bufo bufo]